MFRRNVSGYKNTFLYLVSSVWTRWCIWSASGVFLLWGLVYVTWRSGFSQQQLLECKKSGAYSRTPTFVGKKRFLVHDELTTWDLNNFQGVNNVFLSGDIFSVLCSTGDNFLRLSKGYYHSESFSRFLFRLLNLPILGEWRNGKRSVGQPLIDKARQKTPNTSLLILILFSRLYRGFQVVCFLQVSSPKLCMHIFYPPYAPYVPPFSLFSILSPE